jgi:hypothetical protein
MVEQRWNPVCERPTGLVFPEHLDPTGENGPTRVEARSSRWDWLAPGWYARADRPECVEQRILDAACRLRSGDAVTGWAALRWRGGNFFDGYGPGGQDQLPVPLVARGSLVSLPGITLSKAQLAPTEWEYLAGLPVATVQRALFDEVVDRNELWSGVEAVCMAAAARLISTRLFSVHLRRRRAWTGVPLARKVADLARDDLRSPPEVRLHLIWELVAELNRVSANQPVFDLDGNLIGIPDLFDPVSGTVGEYNGEHHRAIEQHRSDVSREHCFRDHGLEYFTVVRGDSRSTVAARMRRTRARAKFLPQESRSWTLDPRPWYVVPESLDDYFQRTGLEERLTHR